MRNISDTLKAAQYAASNTPYIHLLFTSADGDPTYDYSSDLEGRRILLINHQEEAYNDYASIVLRNNDRTIPDLKGYWTEIGYGYVADGNEYSSTARLWVKHQQEISVQGKMVVLLELEGMWAKLKEMPARVGNPPYYIDDDSTLLAKTVYECLEIVLETHTGMTLSALTEDDGIMDTYQPNMEVNEQPFESYGGLLYRLLSMTKSYLRARANLTWEVKFPQASDPPDLNYFSYHAPYFYEYMERLNVLIPNHVYVFANSGTDGLWTDILVGEASDTAEIALYADIIKMVIAGLIDDQDDADNRAAAVLTRARMEVLAGRLYAPHDCRVELYDRVRVLDARGT